MGDAADGGEVLVEMEMGFGVGGWTQLAAVIGDVAVEIEDDEVIGGKVGVGDAAGFDAP